MFANIDLKSNQAHTFTTQTTGDTFLFINNGGADVDYNEDNFIKITGYTGNLSDLTIG